MHAGAAMQSKARRTWWRRAARRRSWQRHPVSTTRERIGRIIFALLVLGLTWYGITTRDEAIRRRAVEFLSRATGAEVHVGFATFRMFGGITLNNVQLLIPADAEVDDALKTPRARELFSARSVRLIHDPWLLLFGHLRVERVVAAQPKITLVQNVETGMRNWQGLAATPTAPVTRGYPRPIITVRDAKAVFVALHRDGTEESHEESLDADVRPQSQTESGYCIELRRYTDPPDRTAVIFDPGARLVTNTPFVDAKTVRLQLPRAAMSFFDRIALAGEVKLSRMIYEARETRPTDAQIELRRVQCRIPLSMLRSGDGRERAAVAALAAPDADDPDEVAVAMNDVHGTINLQGDKLDLDIAGRVNGAPCRVRGRVTGSADRPDEMGIDLHIRAERMAAPEGKLRRRLLEAALVPETPRMILADYDPHGDFDISMRIRRPEGPGQIARSSGYFAPLGASAAFSGFPYTLDQLHGRIRFEEPLVLVEELVGRHDSAIVNIESRIDTSQFWSVIDVRVDGIEIPLDSSLHALLPTHYRALWDRFNPQGCANLTVYIHRGGGPEAVDEPPWSTRVEADFNDADLLFLDFPYPLTGVTGKLIASADRLQVAGLTGRNAAAVVRIDGFARIEEAPSSPSADSTDVADAPGPETAGPEPMARFTIDAKALCMDDALAAALPPEGRVAFDQFQPEGTFDLAGMLEVPADGGDLRYDLVAKLCDATIRYREFPTRIENVQGEIRIQPDRYTVLDITGKNGNADVLARGRIERRPDGYAADIELQTRELTLNEDLRDALPPALLHIWEILQPRGTISAKTSLHLDTRFGETRQRHRTEIRAKGLDLLFRAFPLQLTNAVAHVVIRDRFVDIESLEGTLHGATIRLSGTVDLEGPGPRGTLVVTTGLMPLDDQLRAALPPKMREVLTSVAPGGRFAVHFDPLRFDFDEHGNGYWDVCGDLRLKDASWNLGFDARGLNGLISGRLVVTRDAAVHLAAETALKSATLQGWVLDDLRARLSTEEGGRRLVIQDAIAGTFGGEATGVAEVETRGQGVAYQASFVARDVMLSRFLQHLSGTDTTSAHGVLRGNVILQGLSGPNGYHEGAGELFVRKAEVWRLPIMFAIFQVLNLTPDENVFHDGWIKYYLSNDTLTFQKIDLQGKAMAFVGGGRLDLASNQLDITLLAGSPIRLRLPLLTDLLEGASRELMEVRVTGTMGEPNIKPQPLKSLTRALQTIFPEPPPRETRRPAVAEAGRDDRASSRSTTEPQGP